MEPSRETAPFRSKARQLRDRSLLGAGLVTTGSVLTCLVVFFAPLLVGSVHRPAVLLVTVTAGAGAGLILLGQLRRGRVLRVTPSVLLPLALLLIPILQSLPVPAALARRIDPVGDRLLADSPSAASRLRPFSLDPPETRAIIAKAGAALAVFLIAFHVAAGRSSRQLLVRVVASSTVAAMAIGFGHRILGESEIFGHFSGSRGLLNGPFINSNHIAELLELGAFVCVAAAFAGASALNRVGWLAAGLMAGACALGTLSRGAILGLAAGTMAFVWLRAAAIPDWQESGERGGGSPRTMLWVTLMLILLAALAIGLGADEIISRVRDTPLTQEARFAVWKNSLQVLIAHPFGIGRGAFDRIFPVYRTVEAAVEVRFSFIENEPLQYLIEMGWLGFVGVLGTVVLVVSEWARARRRDLVEAALVAALFAVLVHNLVDFGLETLGILIPFAAIMGTVLGRTRDVSERSLLPHLSASVWVATIAGIVVGAFSVAHASATNFDEALAAPMADGARRTVALRAQAAHPVDYFYVLAEAAAEPIAPDASGRSPRLHALNHALQLCPHCPDVHSAVGATLWSLGKRSQALEEWRAAVEIRRVVFSTILPSVWASGARPEELATIAGGDPERLMTAVTFLLARERRDAARKLLPLARQAGAAPEQILLIEAKLDIDAGATEDALKSLGAARKLSPQNPRVFLLLGEANSRAGRIDEALGNLDTGIGMNPRDLPLLRSRLGMVMAQQKWFLAKGALESLENALAEAQLPTTEVHLAAARYYSGLRDTGKASSEYELALTQDPRNAGAWAELGALWESAGRMAPALEAYRQANLVGPGNANVVAAIDRLTARIRTIRAGGNLLP